MSRLETTARRNTRSSTIRSQGPVGGVVRELWRLGSVLRQCAPVFRGYPAFQRESAQPNPPAYLTEVLETMARAELLAGLFKVLKGDDNTQFELSNTG